MRRAALGAVALLLVVTGCSGDPPTTPQTASSSGERSAAEQAVQALGPDAWEQGDALAEAGTVICQEGQQNYKVDEVDSACTAGRSWILPGAQARGGVTASIDVMAERVKALGCESVGAKDWLGEARRYWTDGVQAEPGSLPSARFTCEGAKVVLSPMSATVARVSPISLVGDLTGGTVGTPEVDDFPADVEQVVKSSGQALLWQVTATQTYDVKE